MHDDIVEMVKQAQSEQARLRNLVRQAYAAGWNESRSETGRCLKDASAGWAVSDFRTDLPFHAPH